jgi:tellurite methyltransferase
VDIIQMHRGQEGKIKMNFIEILLRGVLSLTGASFQFINPICPGWLYYRNSKTLIEDRGTMRQDRLKWNEKYQSQNYPDEPAAIVRQYFNLAAGKNALDIAAGNGRNALFLARQGFVVDAVDIADTGLSQFAKKHPGIHPICADLDDFDIPASRYDLIVNIKYLNRRLFPYIREGLAPGGVLIFETFLDSLHPAKNQPGCRDYLLRENELLHAFLSLRIVCYKEAKDEKDADTAGLASLVAVKVR